jgi:hypothetical protein
VKRLTSAFLLALGVTLFLSSGSAWAASGSITLSPGSDTVAPGGTLSVNVFEDSGAEPVNAAKITINYPADKFDFVRISPGSVFDVGAISSGGSGSVQIERGATSPQTGSHLVATVSLKAKVNTGGASLAIASGSILVSANDHNALTTSLGSANYAFSDVAPASPSSPGTDTIPPAITDIKAEDVTPTTVTINWKTSEPASSEVNYGLNENYGLVTVDSARVTDHKMVLSSPLMTPGTTYHFVIKNSDAAGNVASSKDSTFDTAGITLTVKVTDQSGKPISGAKVTFGDTSAVTDKDGVASLKGLTSGNQSGTVEYRKHGTPVKAAVRLTDPKNPTQNVSYKITPAPSSPILPVIVLLAFAALALYILKGGHGGNGGKGNMWKDRISKLSSKHGLPNNSAPGGKPSNTQPNESVIQPSKK